MNHCYLFLIFSLLISLISGRALYYDQLDEDDDTKSLSNDGEEAQDPESKLSNLLTENYDDNNLSFDSYEEKKFHQRALFSTSKPSHTISAHTRQAIIDILQKAFDQGWRPNLKHYIPATRFGRHRR